MGKIGDVWNDAKKVAMFRKVRNKAEREQVKKEAELREMYQAMIDGINENTDNIHKIQERLDKLEKKSEVE